MSPARNVAFGRLLVAHVANLLTCALGWPIIFGPQPAILPKSSPTLEAQGSAPVRDYQT